MKLVLIVAALIFSPFYAASALDPLTAFSDPRQVWGNGVERVIEEFFRANFRTKIIGGRVMNIRMPFAMNHERDALSGTTWTMEGHGKASPQVLWPIIEDLLDTDDFREFVRALSSGREKVVVFDLPSQTWRATANPFYVAGMRAGFYRGLPHRPHVLVSGRGILESDVYNYLFSIGRVGVDCSGFVWHALDHIGRQGGINLGAILRRDMRAPPGADPAHFAGTDFFNSNSRYIMPVEDSVRNLRPADIMLFRGHRGDMAHAALIQSVDFERGVIRYIQSTDEAPLNERGVHDSFIYFDPANPDVSLRDPSLRWSKQRFSPFPGEWDSPFADDGERFRAFSELGGSRIVRLRPLIPVIDRLNASSP